MASSGSRGRGILRLFSLAVLLGFGWLAFNFVSVFNAAQDAQERSATGDAIVVLGAAQYDGEPSPVLAQRLDAALGLFEEGAASQVVTTGSSLPGEQFTEGFAAFRYLRNNGVAEEAIVVITDGGDTYESLLATANQLPEEQRSVVLVTDAYHALRSQQIGKEVGLDPIVVASSDNTSFNRLLRETAGVSVGRIISYRRVSGWLGDTARSILS